MERIKSPRTPNKKKYHSQSIGHRIKETWSIERNEKEKPNFTLLDMLCNVEK